MMSRTELSCVMWWWCNDMQMLPSEFWDTRVPVTDDRGEHIWVISPGTLKINFDLYLGVWIYNSEEKQSSVKPTLLLPDVVKPSCSWDGTLTHFWQPLVHFLLRCISLLRAGECDEKVNCKVEKSEIRAGEPVHCIAWPYTQPNKRVCNIIICGLAIKEGLRNNLFINLQLSGIVVCGLSS